MQFKTWVPKSGLEKTEIADKLGISRQAVYNLMKGARPKWELAQQISKLSKGQVTPAEWYK